MTRDGVLTIAEPRSIRSRFALSTKQRLEGDLRELRDAFKRYPTLQRNLEGGGSKIDRSTPLREGPTVREQVFEGPEVAFDGDVRAGVVISLWELSPAAAVPRVAEISYRCETIDGRMSGKAARAALALFLDLQRELDVEVRYPSKTKLALPARADGSASCPPAS